MSPVVWALGVTSLLTDIASEMVASILPVYLVLHLHFSPLQFAAIDGLYNGLSVALVALASGVLADRWRRHKRMALLGYALSALCKLGLVVAGSAWGFIMSIVALDRIGKGIRTAPRDSIISLRSRPATLGTAFGVHRALDATGAFIGPLIAFALLSQVPNAFDTLWIVSFIVACLGVAALYLYVPPDFPTPEPATPQNLAGFSGELTSRRFVQLAAYSGVLALLTVSDGFLYLVLQQKSELSAGFLPLLYVGTAIAYMLFAIPAGLLADRYSRTRVFVSGYVLLLSLYAVLWLSEQISTALVLACVALLGLYYAATEGVLMALGSAIVPRAARATGLAILATSVGIGRLFSSIAFGWIWQNQGIGVALASFMLGGFVALTLVASRLKFLEHG